MADRVPLVLPIVRSAWRVTSPYGYRTNPVTGKRQLHNGLDVGVPVGTAIHAPFAGRVVKVWDDDDLNGTAIKIDSEPSGLSVSVAHLSRRRVNVGDRVKAGQIVGDSGNSGRSTGPHAHIRLDVSGTATDPAPLLADAIDPATLPASVTSPGGALPAPLLGLAAAVVVGAVAWSAAR